MPDYIGFPVTTDPEDLAEDAFTYLQTKFPGWSPSSGNLEVILVESLARMVAEARDVASTIPKTIFRYFGNSILGISPIDDTFAVGNSTWVARDNAGYTIAAGTQIGIRAAGDELIAYRTLFDVVIPPGSTTTSAGGVSIVAAIAGSHASGLGGGAAELIDTLDWVSSITIVGVTTGGVDAETDDSYLIRLATQLTLLSPVPILPRDYATFVLNIPGVGRALAIDGYDPVNQSLNNERMVSLVVTDINGETLSATQKSAIQIAVEAVREVTFVVNVIDPTYSTIDISVSFTTASTAVAATVQDNVIAALEEYLNPAKWGTLSSFGEIASTKDWHNTTIVQVYEIVTVVNNVPGVERISLVTMAITGGAMVTTDITLPGVAPITRPGTITAVAV